ncbi:MAG: hydrogenase 3 maturation endopeptidase HyCI, partial [Candidatus Edwardsbacteria bacterium]|nr:hydrogenase 3 maturation endopeptidase HyCI [Candidatus Edwardsbacteria bacterium]
IEAALRAAKTIAVLGIGNEMLGDDAAGVLLARELKKKAAGRKTAKRIYVYETGTTPENFTGAISPPRLRAETRYGVQARRVAPDLVLLADAADMGAPVGEIRALDVKDLRSMMHSTHTMPLSFLAGYIEKTTSAKVIALGIQAGHIRLDQPMSRAVAAGVRQAARLIAGILRGAKPEAKKIRPRGSAANAKGRRKLSRRGISR